MSMTKLFRAKTGKMKDTRMSTEMTDNVQYPTGFLGFDFLNGEIKHVKTDTMDFSYNSIGIVDGSMVLVLGRTGCGKTTLVTQWAGEISRPFGDDANVYMDNIEGGISDERVRMLMGFEEEEFNEKTIIRNSGVTAENFYQRIKMIHDIKIENSSDFQYNTGLLTRDGKPITKYKPTVYILDSLAMLMPEKLTEEEELSGQMSATAAAKTNASIFKRIIPMLKATNIILFVVSHITENVDIGVVKKRAQNQYLKQDEAVSGGRTPLYVANLIIKLYDNSKLLSEKGLGIDGSIVELVVAKSRTCSGGSSINIIFDFVRGFDKELSLYQLMKERGYINGAGAYLYFGEFTDQKFAQKNIKTKLAESEEFRHAFTVTAKQCLNDMLVNKDKIKTADSNVIQDIMTSILSNNVA